MNLRSKCWSGESEYIAASCFYQLLFPDSLFAHPGDARPVHTHLDVWLASMICRRFAAPRSRNNNMRRASSSKVPMHISRREVLARLPYEEKRAAHTPFHLQASSSGPHELAPGELAQGLPPSATLPTRWQQLPFCSASRLGWRDARL